MQPLAEAVDSHYRRFLGVPAGMRSVSLPAHPEGQYQLRKYQDVPSQGAITLATIGLCDVPLHMFRQEFLFLSYERFASDDLFTLIAVIAQMVSESEHPLLHGSVLPPAGPLLEYTSMEALYVGTLMYFDTSEEQFDLLKTDDELSVLFSWLIPIYGTEVDWIAEHGWEAFEDLVVEQDPDLMDLERPCIL